MTDQQPPAWAINRANSLADKGDPRCDRLQKMGDAFAHYIATHEQAPVDPDVFDVRAILAEYVDCVLVGNDAAQQLHDGRKDNSIGFINALDRFRFALNKRAAPTHDLSGRPVDISKEQMTLWTRRLLVARWMAQGEVARARSVENGTQDHNVAFVAVRAVLAEILAGQTFG